MRRRDGISAPQTPQLVDRLRDHQRLPFQVYTTALVPDRPVRRAQQCPGATCNIQPAASSLVLCQTSADCPVPTNPKLAGYTNTCLHPTCNASGLCLSDGVCSLQLDSDLDGFGDICDTCPYKFDDPWQPIDLDGNGIGSCDKCPGVGRPT